MGMPVFGSMVKTPSKRSLVSVKYSLSLWSLRPSTPVPLSKGSEDTMLYAPVLMSTDQIAPLGGSATRIVWLFGATIPSGKAILGMYAATDTVGVWLLRLGKVTR